MLSEEYLKTARTFLRVAKNITDQAIADRLKALAEDYERRAKQASRLELLTNPIKLPPTMNARQASPSKAHAFALYSLPRPPVFQPRNDAPGFINLRFSFSIAYPAATFYGPR